MPESSANWYTGYESSAKAKHIHSININGYNTWDDWHLIPSSRPVINPPEKKSSVIDVPGANGSIDESDSLTGFPIYATRQGSWEFYVDNNDIFTGDSYGYWEARRTEIADAIHGIQCIVSLDDDPSWYYAGTVAINEWKSDKDYSKLVIDYVLYPYKRAYAASDEDWLWDPFNFETDWIYSNPQNDYLENHYDSDFPVINLSLSNTEPVPIEERTIDPLLDGWNYLAYPAGFFAREPLSPEVIGSANNNLLFKMSNPELGINHTDFNNGAGISIPTTRLRIPGVKFSTISKRNIIKIYLKAESSGDTGTVSFIFRTGRL